MKAFTKLLNINIYFKRNSYQIQHNTDLNTLFNLLKTERNNYSISSDDKDFFFRETLIDYLIYRNSTNLYISYYNPVNDEIKIDGHNNFLIQNSRVIKLKDQKEIYESFSNSDFYFLLLYLQAAMKYNKYLLSLETEKLPSFTTKEIMKTVNKKEQLILHLIVKQSDITSYEDLKNISFTLMN